MSVRRVFREWDQDHLYLEVHYRMTDVYGENVIDQWINRFLRLQEFLVSDWEFVHQRSGGQPVMGYIYVQSEFGDIQTLNRPQNPFGLHRRFFSVQDIEDHFYNSAMQALDNLTASEQRDMDLTELMWVANFIVDRRANANLVVPARGRWNLNKRVQKTLGTDIEGLAKYEAVDGYCGYHAIVYLLCCETGFRDYWTGSLDWFYKEMKTGNQYKLTDQLKSKKRVTALVRSLARELVGDPDNGEWVFTTHNSTAARFVQFQPRYQVVVYNEVNKRVLFHYKGRDFDPALAEKCTVLLSYTLGHAQLIKHIAPYLLNKAHETRSFCYLCLDFRPRTGHECRPFEGVQCKDCFVKFPSEQLLAEHREPTIPVQCANCKRTLANELCLRSHRCTARDRVETCDQCGKTWYGNIHSHRCDNTRVCVCCHQFKEPGHRCFIQREKMPEWQAPDEAGGEYYAFDLESMIGVETLQNGFERHVVNLCVVQRCFSNEPPLIFDTLEQFIAWAESLKKAITLWAHNLKGYDGRLVYDYLFQTNRIPERAMWRGCKLWSFDYGPIRFCDTLLHISAASLAQLPGMFGLDTSRFKKGFFPHLFNRPENQQYVGPIPDKKYFGPDDMRAKSAAEFDRWHAEQEGREWNFQEELRAYCVSDTLILAKAIEAYMTQQMAGQYCMNPLEKKTIASYAMSMYRTYFMPENSLARLSPREARDIRGSMHGGRTDTRCMLREWSDEEVAAGVYGKYQDVQSLYPTVQFYDPLPVGHPQYRVFLLPHEQPTLQQLMSVFGFVCCDIEPTRYLHHPILVHNDPTTGKLLCDLNPKTNLVVPTPELHLALQHGYRVNRVHWWYHFNSSTDLFKSYFRQFLAGKLKASGVPDWVKTDQDWAEFQDTIATRLGIQLERSEMVKNAAAKTGAKLLCNSLWGKFGERMVGNQTYKCFNRKTDMSEIVALEMEHMNERIDIKQRMRSPDLSQVMIIFERRIEPDEKNIWARKHLSKTNIALASMVTSHARCRLWTELNRLGDRVLYHDTDSIIYEHRPGEYTIPEGRYLGEWEDETGGQPIRAFVSTGPKSYAYRVGEKDVVKMKGVSLSVANAKRLRFEDLKTLVLDSSETIETNALMFNYNRYKGHMSTGHTLKLVKNTYDKGFVDPRTYKVYPFGWERFLDPATMAVR